jgi:hypothetical protein
VSIENRPIGGMTVDEYIIYNKGYTVGLEIGEAIAEERIIKLLEPHRMTLESVSGFLGVCTCGEAMDDYQEHLLNLIKG